MSARPPLLCRTCEANGVKTPITFNKDIVSASGKQIPLEASNKQRHSCPFREKNGPPPSIPSGDKLATEEEAAFNRLERDLLQVADLQRKETLILERIETLLKRVETTFAAIIISEKTGAKLPENVIPIE